jgi:hypothetical protein
VTGARSLGSDGLLIGYARVSSDEQDLTVQRDALDLTAQRDALAALGIATRMNRATPGPTSTLPLLRCNAFAAWTSTTCLLGPLRAGHQQTLGLSLRHDCGRVDPRDRECRPGR